MNPLDLHRKVVKEGREQNPALSFGINFAAGMGIFVFLGWKMDRRRGEDAIGWTLAGVALGFLYGGYELWKIVRAAPPPPPDNRTPPP